MADGRTPQLYRPPTLGLGPKKHKLHQVFRFCVTDLHVRSARDTRNRYEDCTRNWKFSQLPSARKTWKITQTTLINVNQSKNETLIRGKSEESYQNSYHLLRNPVVLWNQQTVVHWDYLGPFCPTIIQFQNPLMNALIGFCHMNVILIYLML